MDIKSDGTNEGDEYTYKKDETDRSQRRSEKYPMVHFSRGITQYRSHGRSHREIRSFSRRFSSPLCSSKSKKIALFCYLTWLLRFAMA